jgi:hypothetical protein
MADFEALLKSVAQIKTLEQRGYAFGCANTLYAHDLISRDEYDIIFKLIKEVLL